MTCEEKLKKLLAALDIVLQDNNIGKDWRVHPYAVFMDEEDAYLAVRVAVLEAEGDKK
jgi:hypothetical protein